MGGGKEPEALVFGAELRCLWGSAHNNLLTKDYASKGINGLPAKFVVTDCIPGINIMPFGDCDAGDQCVYKWKLASEWTNPGVQNETFGDKAIITTASQLVCDAYGMFILPVNSGQNSDIGKQLILLAELDSELLEFLMNPFNSIYTPNDISQEVLDMLDQIVNSDLYGGSISLIGQGTKDIMGPIILACIGHLVPGAHVSDPGLLLADMENMISRTKIITDADPRNLDSELFAILKADSVLCAREVANGGWDKFQQEHKKLGAFLADLVTTAAYVTIMYAGMQGQQGGNYQNNTNEDSSNTTQNRQPQGQTQQGQVQQGQTSGGNPVNSPDFVVTPNGDVIPVPKGATGPVDVVNPAGNVTGQAYTGGSGGANGQVSNVRIMDPTPPRGNSPGYPNGYVKYENSMGQGVDPNTGRTLPNSQSHFPLGP